MYTKGSGFRLMTSHSLPKRSQVWLVSLIDRLIAALQGARDRLVPPSLEEPRYKRVVPDCYSRPIRR